MAEHYDSLIIGGGQGGIPLAWALAAAGRKVGLAERKYLGGSCVNFGCTPTKAAIASARVAYLARAASEYGLRIPAVEVDFPRVLDRAQAIADASRNRLESSFETSTNPQLLHGHARFLGRSGQNFSLSIDDLRVTAREVVLDTGTRSTLAGLEIEAGIVPLSGDNWLHHRELPRQLLMIGGGYIGLEMGQFYRRMGSEVTIVEGASQVLEHEDREVAEALQRTLETEGIRFLMNTRVSHLSKLPDGIQALMSTPEGDLRMSASAAFIALGRQVNTDDLALDLVGVRTTQRGIVQVDERLATNVPGIWAMGDIRGGPMFTHTSWDDYRIIESQLLGNGSRTLDRVVPYAVFTDPELGRVGMTEKEAREQGRPIKVGHFEMRHNGKAKELGEAGGFIKIVADADSKRLLGAAIVSSDAAELVHQYIALMNARCAYTVMQDSVYIHPTLAEATQSALATLQ